MLTSLFLKEVNRAFCFAWACKITYMIVICLRVPLQCEYSGFKGLLRDQLLVLVLQTFVSCSICSNILSSLTLSLVKPEIWVDARQLGELGLVTLQFISS